MPVLHAEMEAKLKAEKKGGGEALASPLVVTSSHSTSKWRSFTRPSWLLCTIADLDKKMKKLAVNIPNKDSADSFTERADSYYQKRPQLLALLQELYDSYLSLADRYCQALAKNHHRRNSFPISSFSCDDNDRIDKEEHGSEVIDSDAESSLSYQPQFLPAQAKLDADMIVADLVIRTVDYEIILHELSEVEKNFQESSRKIELQKSLLELLESERSILLNENARLGYTMASLMEENKGLSSESLFMKRKVAELARFMLNTRENHRVCVLSRKVEDLQGQINGLEKRNKEYYEQLMKHEEEKKTRAKKSLKGCFKVPEETVGVGISCDSLGNVRKGDQQGKGLVLKLEKKFLSCGIGSKGLISSFVRLPIANMKKCVFQPSLLYKKDSFISTSSSETHAVTQMSCSTLLADKDNMLRKLSKPSQNVSIVSGKFLLHVW